MNFSVRELKNTETVAEVLSAARQAQNGDLERLEKTLKITKRYLVALEKGDYAALPGDLYVRLFAKTYGEALGVSWSQLEPIVEREILIHNQVVGRSESVSSPAPMAETVRVTPHTIRVGAVVLGALGCVLYLAWQLNAIFSPPPLTIDAPASDSITSTPTLTVHGTTTPEVSVTINGQATLTDTDGTFTQVLNLQPGMNTVEIIAKKKRSRPRTVTRQVMVTTEPTPPSGEVLDLAAPNPSF